jgi:hypothetical protein
LTCKRAFSDTGSINDILKGWDALLGNKPTPEFLPPVLLPAVTPFGLRGILKPP